MADTGVLLIKSLDKGFVIHGDTIKILQASQVIQDLMTELFKLMMAALSILM